MLISLVTVILTTTSTFATDLLGLNEESTENEFARLERVTDRLEERLNDSSRRNDRLERKRDTLTTEVRKLQRRVSDLSWGNYRLGRTVKTLKTQIASLGKTPILPPKTLYSPQPRYYDPLQHPIPTDSLNR